MTVSLTGRSQAPLITWVQRAGGGCDNIGVALDPAGALCVKGTHARPATFGDTVLVNPGIFLAKYEPNGNLIWARQAVDTVGSEGGRLAVDAAGNIYFSGGFYDKATFGSITLTNRGQGDVFLAKCDRSGQVLWARQAGGPGPDAAEGVAVDDDGNIYVTGGFGGTASFGGTNLSSVGGTDLFLAKYAPGGALLWVAQAGGPADDHGRTPVIDAAGNLFVTGEYDGLVTFGTNTFAGGSESPFLAKYDRSGRLLWAKPGGGGGLAADAQTNIYARGTFSGTLVIGGTTLISRGGEDMYVCKYNDEGDVLWLRQAGGLADDDTEGLAVDSVGNCYLTGRVWGNAAFDGWTLTNDRPMTVFVAKYTAVGQIAWVATIAQCDEDMGSNIAVDRSGICYTGNPFAGAARVGKTKLRNADGWDLAIARLGGIPATLRIANITVSSHVTLTVEGEVGSDLALEYASRLPESRPWIELTNLFLPASPHLIFDFDPPQSSNRFYRAVELP